MTIGVIVCAYNEARYLTACLKSLRAQTRRPDDILVVNNASADATGAVARAVPGVRVVDEPIKGLVVARETARLHTQTDILAYVDADCRAPMSWLERVETRFRRSAAPVAVTGPYRFYDWDLTGRAMIRAYDYLIAPPTHFLVHHALGLGAILYGGNFAVRSAALAAIGGFDRTIEFHGEDTNLGRRLTPLGRVELARDCWVWTSARRYRAMGKRAVIGLYIRNFWSEISAAPARGPSASRREGVACLGTNRFSSATSMSTRAGATAACRCARSSICMGRPEGSTSSPSPTTF